MTDWPVGSTGGNANGLAWLIRSLAGNSATATVAPPKSSGGSGMGGVANGDATFAPTCDGSLASARDEEVGGVGHPSAATTASAATAQQARVIR